MKKDKKVKTGIYKHYKGNLYEVLDMARHSETEELLVVYRTLYDDGGIWVRPYEMFIEDVKLEDKVLKRFEYMGKR